MRDDYVFISRQALLEYVDEAVRSAASRPQIEDWIVESDLSDVGLKEHDTVQALAAALRFYANPANWAERPDPRWQPHWPRMGQFVGGPACDRGEHARYALELLENGELAG